MVVPEHLIPMLEEMLYELSENRLEVCLIPGKIESAVNDGKLIRVAHSTNVKWYQDLCADYPCTRNKKRNNRKDYTKIKRIYIYKVLRWMINNKKSESRYADFLLTIAEERYKSFEQYSADVAWDNQF